MLTDNNGNNKRKAVFIGAGNIGSALINKVYNNSDILHLEPYAIIRRSGASYCKDGIQTTWENVLNELREGDVAFIATPSDGTAIPYIEESLRKGIYAVSCEKTTPSSNYPLLAPYIDIFYKDNANVGGNTGLKPATKQLIETHGLFSGYDWIAYVLNGTTGHILKRIPEIKKDLNGSSDIANEATKLVFQEVLDKGFPEPGKNTPFEILEEEIYGDIFRKAAIMTNYIENLISSANLPNNTPQDIKLTENVNTQSILRYISELTDKNTKLVTVIRQGNLQKITDYKIAELTRPEFTVEIGFMKNTTGDLAEIEGVLNGAVIGNNGTYRKIVDPQPGAGADATSKQMLKDWMELIETEKAKNSGLYNNQMTLATTTPTQTTS